MARDANSPAPVLFLGKRFYTNKDAWAERFGRVFHLPAEWARSGENVLLWLVDYHTREKVDASEGRMMVWSLPVLSLGMLVALFKAARLRPEAVVASGDCYIGLLGWMLARCTGARFVFDIYDKYDEFGAYYRPFGFDLFGFLRRRADMRFYASQALERLNHGEDRDGDVVVIANGVDDQLFRPLSMTECRARLQLDQDACLVGYFGGMEPDRGVSDLIAAVAVLREQGGNVQLLICGRQHPSTSLGHPWILYRGMVAHDEMPYYLNAADLLVVPYRLSPFMDMGASCKIAEYLMCERPIVSTRTPNFVANFPELAVELAAGLCEPADVDGLARAVSRQLRDKVILSPPSNLGWPAIAAQALAAIHSLAAGDRAHQ